MEIQGKRLSQKAAACMGIQFFQFFARLFMLSMLQTSLKTFLLTASYLFS